MLDIFDSEALIKCYRMLNKKCKAIDKFIETNSLYFGASYYEYGAIDVVNNIIDLMTRKNQLINLKIIIDNAINSLDEKDRKILYIKMNYNLKMDELCDFLSLKERTAFRRIERAYLNLSEALNNSKYLEKLVSIMEKEIWINDVKNKVKDRRKSYKGSLVFNNL